MPRKEAPLTPTLSRPKHMQGEGEGKARGKGKARGAAIQAIALSYRKRPIAAQRVMGYVGKSRIATIIPRASAVIRRDRIGHTIFWAVTFYDAAGNRLFNRLCRSRYRAERLRDRLIAACVEIAQQRQRPGEICGEIGGRFAAKPGGQDGRKAIKSKEKASRHVAKVASARAGRN